MGGRLNSLSGELPVWAGLWLFVVLSSAMFSIAAHAETRVALVIGNSNYASATRLFVPGNDAKAIAKALQRVGFSVDLRRDLSMKALTSALRKFAVRAANADAAVVYYSGHGIEVDGVNYLVPVDARLTSARDINLETLPLGLVLHAVERARRLKLVVLDASRNSPFSPQLSSGLSSFDREFAPVESEGDVLVAYSAKPGTTTEDGTGRNGPFAAALARELVIPGLDVVNVFARVNDDVRKATGGRQEPLIYGNPSGGLFYFVPPTRTRSPNPSVAVHSFSQSGGLYSHSGGSGTFSRSGGSGTFSRSASSSRSGTFSRSPGEGRFGSFGGLPFGTSPRWQADVEMWNSVSDSNDIKDLQSYLDQFPKGMFVAAARAKIALLTKSDSTAYAHSGGLVERIAGSLKGGSTVLPEFWPPPTPSEMMDLPRERIIEGPDRQPSLIEIGTRLAKALDSAGYSEFSFYRAPDGFAVVARMEQIEPDGTPSSSGVRFLPPDAAEPFSLSGYIQQLFVAPEGFYRVIAFVVTDVPIVVRGPAPQATTAEAWAQKGADKLPQSYAMLNYSENYQVSILIYEFRKLGKSTVSTLVPGRLDVPTHLKKSGLYAFLMSNGH